MNINLDTKLEYNFSNFSVTPEKQLSIIRKHEKLIEDTSFSSILRVVYTTSAQGEEWYKIFILLKQEEVEVCYSDKMLYITEYEKFRDLINKDEKPFYNTATYKLLGFISNEGANIKYSLVEVIELCKVIYHIANNEC